MPNHCTDVLLEYTNDQLRINHLDALCRAMSTEKIQIGNVMEQDVCVNKLTPSMPRNGTCKRVPIKFCLIISRVFLFLLRSAWRFLWFRKIKVHIRNGRRAKPTTTWFFFLVSWEIYVPDFRFYELRICFHVRIFRLRKGQLLISVYLYLIFFGEKKETLSVCISFFSMLAYKL